MEGVLLTAESRIQKYARCPAQKLHARPARRREGSAVRIGSESQAANRPITEEAPAKAARVRVVRVRTMAGVTNLRGIVGEAMRRQWRASASVNSAPREYRGEISGGEEERQHA